jgi:hypothetical protein
MTRVSFITTLVCAFFSFISTGYALTVCNDVQAVRTINVLQNQKQEVAAGRLSAIDPSSDATIKSLAQAHCFQTVGADPLADNQDTIEFACTLLSGVYQNIRVYWTSCPSHTATFIMRNGTDEQMGIVFYSMERDYEWPGNNMQYNLGAGQSNQYALQCGTRERICYGSWFDPDWIGTYWGIGHDRGNGCEDCCLNCGDTIRVPDLVR